MYMCTTGKTSTINCIFQGKFHATRGHNCIIISITQWNVARAKLTRMSFVFYWIKLFMCLTLSTRLINKQVTVIHHTRKMEKFIEYFRTSYSYIKFDIWLALKPWQKSPPGIPSVPLIAAKSLASVSLWASGSK